MRGPRRPASTVRGWLRRFAVMAVALREHFTRWAHALDPGHDRRSPGGSDFFDAVEAVGVLGVVAVRRFGPRPPWSLASVVTGSRATRRCHPPADGYHIGYQWPAIGVRTWTTSVSETRQFASSGRRRTAARDGCVMHV